mmetsp:Transcript_127/g.312  ORF Transcript_127/g.312 Transcript_127/m.312 type:complete len:585 (-) Transcript_127:217-1971(-)|eukprot:CAMPEP_0118943926 /NCGR_PEP_ID=MMETSP1169-20130426/39289_1 /TAXON_ID=36882 /ORGANISM="Pyramimonas obovata, Strain CCMP722" /LENGTH=584 /DNA_ID=CAMNT_0006889289 /DNA_START=183 /DNA_END=1937 /DNA_ORIENTATION=+
MEKTTHYRSPDPIQNLRIKVVLTRLSGPRRIPGQQDVQEEERDRESKKKTEKKKRGKGKKDDKAQSEKDDSEDDDSPDKNKENQKGSRKDKKTDREEPDKPKAGVQFKTEEEQVTKQEFAWQHKVFSKQEVSYYKSLENPTTMLEKKYTREIEERGIEGSMLFTYVHADEFNLKNESSRTVTTSATELLNHLTLNTFRAKSTTKVVQPAHFQSMCIVAELESDEREEKVLVSIKDFMNGSFDMQPGFTPEGATHRFELQDGAVYEYSLHNVDKETKKSEQLQKKAARGDTASDRAFQLRRNLVGNDFTPLPGPSPKAVRVALLAEIVSARGFHYNSLYVEYFIKMGSAWWNCKDQPLRGVTQISKTTTYPTSALSKEEPLGPGTKVAHFCYPIELELVTQEEPKPSEWPVLYFQVASYDQWDRYRTVAYGYLPLGSCSPGTQEHRLKTWKPTGTVRDRLHTFFVGGAPELEDITYLNTPAGFNGKALNKYGFVTDASGEVKIRTNMLLHGRAVVPVQKPKKHQAQTTQAVKTSQITKAPVSGPRSMAEIVERARKRLAETRGGGQEKPHKEAASKPVEEAEQAN